MAKGCIIVTGTSRGIGAAIVRDLERRGAKVAGLSRSGSAPAGIGFACDVTDEEMLTRTVQIIAGKYRIIGLVNNAGLHEAAPSASFSTADFERVMRVNTVAPFLLSRLAYPHLKEAGGGTIINIGSFFDKLGVANNVAYAASKAAVGAITRCLAVEWARDNIRVINIAPGYIETDLNKDFLSNDRTQAWLSRRVPMGRAGKSEEVARFIGSVMTEDVAYLTGETIYLDGAHSVNH